MAEWIIDRGIPGLPQEVVEADVMYPGKDEITLTNYNDGGIVCAIVPTPGLLVVRKDVRKS